MGTFHAASTYALTGRIGHTNGSGTGGGTGRTGETPVMVDRGIGDAHQVNAAALQMEADAALASAPVEPVIDPATGAPAPTGPSIDDMAAGYAELGSAALDMLTEAACPAWEITDDEKNKFSGALGRACALWFPNDIPEKWIALIVLAGVGGRIVASRRDPATGGFIPRFRKPVTVEQRPAPAGPAPDPHRPLN